MSLTGLTGDSRMPTRASPPDVDHRLSDLEREADAVLDRAAVGVGALVGAVAQELVDQIAVGGVDFDAVEAGSLGVFGRRGIVRDDPRDLVEASARAASKTSTGRSR